MNSQFTIGAVGDISLESDVSDCLWDNVQDFLHRSDLLFGNLETSISNKTGRYNKAVPLSVPISRLKEIDSAGFDVLNLANNHVLDSGIKSLYKSASWFRESDIKTVGLNYPHPNSCLTIVEHSETLVGVLGYTESVGQFSLGDLFSQDLYRNGEYFIGRRNTYYTPSKTRKAGLLQHNCRRIVQDIKIATQYCDVLIVSLHWGTENVFYPSPRQIIEARLFIDGGADVVLGHHPHVPQGVEQYNGGIIAYSLGNFQFDTKKSKSPTNYSFGIKINIYNNKIKNYEIVPVKIDESNRPIELRGSQKQKVIKEIHRISDPIENNELTWKRWFSQAGSKYLSDNIESYKTRISDHGSSSIVETFLWLGSPFTLRCIAGEYLQYNSTQSLYQAKFPDMNS